MPNVLQVLLVYEVCEWARFGDFIQPRIVQDESVLALTPFPPNLKLNVDVYGPMRYQKPVFDGRTWTQRRDNRVLTFSFSGKVGF